MAINMDAVLELSAKVDGMSQLLQLERSLADVKGQLNKYEGAQKTATAQSGLFNAATVALGGFIQDAAYKAVDLVRQTAALGFSYEQTQTRLRMLSEGYGEHDAVQKIVAKNAETLGQSQVQAANGFADIYARLRPIGVSLEDVNAVYLGFNSLALQSGTTAEAASGAFMQLSQALGSGTLRGDEFNSVAEQVPGILIEVANVMGQPVGALRELAKDGQITSDVVIKAMRNAATEGGASLGELTQSAANAGNRLTVAFQDAQAMIGRELVPALAPLLDGLTNIIRTADDYLIPVVQNIAEGWQWVHSVITDQLLPALDPLIKQFRQATAGMDVTEIAKIWQGAMVISIQNVVKAIEILTPMVSTVVGAFRWLIDNTPFGMIAKKVAEAAGGLAKVRDETIGVNKEAATTDKTMASVAGKTTQIRTATVDTKEELKKQEEARKKLLEQLREEQKYVDAISDKQKAILGIQMDQAEKQREKYDGTEAEFAALIRIRDLKLKQAELDYKAEQAKIRAQVALGQMTDREAQVRLEILKIQYDSTKATINQAHEQEVLNERAERLKALTQETVVETVTLTEETAEYTAEIERATTHMIKLHGELREVDLAVVRISRGWMSVQEETLLAAGAAYEYDKFISRTAERIADLRKEGTSTSKALAEAIRNSLDFDQLVGVDRKLRKMAVGGYVTGPTPALIGEGGEPEYVIPASKMLSALGNFLMGARGMDVLSKSGIPATLEPGRRQSSVDEVAALGRFNQNGEFNNLPAALKSQLQQSFLKKDEIARQPQLNITTGPVLEFNGNRYVTVDDMQKALVDVLSQVLGLMNNSGVRQMLRFG